jgi:hypothetical protein
VLFDREPWYWYLVRLFEQMGPVVILALVGIRRSPFLGGVTFIILLSHSVIPHKEMRFIYPLIPLVITLAAIGLVDLLSAVSAMPKSPFPRTAVVAVCIAIWVATSISLRSRFFYWTKNSGNLTAFVQLSMESDICGVGLYQVSWFNQGGYSYLHKNVPLVRVPDSASLTAQASSFDVILHESMLTQLPEGFALKQCVRGTCLYHREGRCIAPNGTDINSALRQNGL